MAGFTYSLAYLHLNGMLRLKINT